MANFNSGDKVRVKNVQNWPDWPLPKTSKLANAEGRLVRLLEPEDGASLAERYYRAVGAERYYRDNNFLEAAFAFAKA